MNFSKRTARRSRAEISPLAFASHQDIIINLSDIKAWLRQRPHCALSPFAFLSDFKSFFSYSLHSMLFCISFRSRAWWLRQPCTNLQCGSPDTWSAHLAPCRVITILLTGFPTLCFTCLWLFCNCQFVCFNPFTFCTQPSRPPFLLATISLFSILKL